VVVSVAEVRACNEVLQGRVCRCCFRACGVLAWCWPRPRPLMLRMHEIAGVPNNRLHLTGGKQGERLA
jgi:hypothetical protein